MSKGEEPHPKSGRCPYAQLGAPALGQAITTLMILAVIAVLVRIRFPKPLWQQQQQQEEVELDSVADGDGNLAIDRVEL